MEEKTIEQPVPFTGLDILKTLKVEHMGRNH